jgi:hypothetical protein
MRTSGEGSSGRGGKTAEGAGASLLNMHTNGDFNSNFKRVVAVMICA